MDGWFTKLMQKDRARSHRATPAGGASPDARDARYDAIVQMLRDREADDRQLREKRQRWYKEYQKIDASVDDGSSGSESGTRIHRIPTKTPCRLTPEARALLEQLRKRFPGSTVSVLQGTGRQQAVMLTRTAGAEPRQIGWVEHCVETDPKWCNVRDQGLLVESDGGTMLVLRFRYPATPVRVSRSEAAERPWPRTPGQNELEIPGASMDETTSVDFAELRLALDSRRSEKTSAPRLVWLTRPESETMRALGSREYEAFYVKFKLEVLAGIWTSLTSLLSGAPCSQRHHGSYFTVVRETDAAKGRIYQRTVDDTGCAVDIGANRIFDAVLATDLLLLYLEGDILADFADIYFTLYSLGSPDAYFLKEEFFTVIRRFWASAQSLASSYASDLAAVIRMAQRAAPMPAQVSLLRQDWTALRQSLVDRYGVGGQKAADLGAQDVHIPRTRSSDWPFVSFAPGDVNLGLRLVYRQEWKHVGAQRGEIVRTVAGGAQAAETTVVQDAATRSLDEIVASTVGAAVDAMKWPRELDSSVNIGVRSIAASTDMGLESECRASSRDTSTQLQDIMERLAVRVHDAALATHPNAADEIEASSALEAERDGQQSAAMHVHSRLQHVYEVLTQPAQLENVVLVAEKLPAPAEIDLSWVRRHGWILAKVLLDESFREPLDTIHQDRERELNAHRARLYGHIRANILHYQRAIWQQEDPQQRSMRYRKSGRKVPLEWQFELELGAELPIDEFCDRLAAANVDGQFAAYSAGRHADLDQVIDPTGPVGYYGNCAVYRMRAELGSSDLFSMLHFFKSPYLRGNPGTGEIEVVDPAQTRIAERTSRIALDAPGVVIDVIPSLAASDAARTDCACDLAEALSGHELVVEPGRLELLTTNGHRDAEASPPLVASQGDRDRQLRTGNAGAVAETQVAEAHQVIRAHRSVVRTLASRAAHNHAAGARLILSRADDGLTLTPSTGTGPAHMEDQTTPVPEHVITTRGDEGITLSTGRARQSEPELVILSISEGASARLRAGIASRSVEDRVIRALRGNELTITTPGGDAAADPRERVIISRHDDWLRPSPMAG